MSTPSIGAVAPDFSLTADTGEVFSLSAHRGQTVVMFFYPEDDTGGCTIENQEFTALLPAFKKLGVTVVGISPDSVEKHCKFRDKYGLAAPLLADPKMTAITAYSLWGPKVTFGKHHVGLIRTTVIVAPDGTIADIVTVTRIKGHAAAILAQVGGPATAP